MGRRLRGSETLKFGPARRLEHKQGHPSAHQLRSTTDEVMRDISTLSGPEYIDSYA